MANNMSTRKALEIELLYSYSEEPEAFEAGYNNFYKYFHDEFTGISNYKSLSRLAYEAGWNKAEDEVVWQIDMYTGSIDLDF